MELKKVEEESLVEKVIWKHSLKMDFIMDLGYKLIRISNIMENLRIILLMVWEEKYKMMTVFMKVNDIKDLNME